MKSCVIYGHRVSHPAFTDFGPDISNCVSIPDFERLLLDISGHTPGADWPEQLARQHTGQQPFTLLTFDDGYEDLISNALPLMEKYQVPGVIFVTTGFIDRELNDYESTLTEMIAGSRTLSCPQLGKIDFTDDTMRATVYERLRLKLKSRSRLKRERYLDELRRLNPAVKINSGSRFLDWEQVRELDRHPLVTIGAHSQSHILLSRPNPLEVFRELKFSRRRLEAELGRHISLVAYPYGANSALTRLLARLAGYSLGFGTQSGTIEQKFDRMSIPRIGIHEYLRSVPD